MEIITSALTAVTATVIGSLVVANVVSIVGYATHHRRFVERFQRRIVRATSLLRMGVR